MELEHKNLQAWAMNDVHEKILMVDAKNGFPVYGFPSLVAGKESIDLVVFTSRDDQTANHAKGARALAEKCLEKEMAWLNNDLKFGKHLQMLCTPFAKLEEFKASLMTLLENHCFDHVDFEIRKRSEFEKIITRVKAEFSSEGPKLTMVLEKVLDGIVEFQSMIKRRLTNYNMASYKEIANSIKKEMQKYVTNLLDNKLNYKVFLQQNRYLSAFRYRIDRAFSDMPKYLLKYEIIRPYLEKSDSILSKVHGYSKEKQALIFDFVQMVEEFKISTFAQQEIKTLFPVSQKKVDEKWEEVKRVLKV
jgi:ATP-dependent helicase HrpA